MHPLGPLDIWVQINLYYFKDKYGSIYTVLKVNPRGGLQLQCVSRLNKQAVFCIHPESVRLKASLYGTIHISKRKKLKEGSTSLWKK